MSINWKKPTAMMLGRYQPFHNGHKALFKEIIRKTGQVVIMIRNTEGIDDSNPFNFETVTSPSPKQTTSHPVFFIKNSGSGVGPYPPII